MSFLLTALGCGVASPADREQGFPRQQSQSGSLPPAPVEVGRFHASVHQNGAGNSAVSDSWGNARAARPRPLMKLAPDEARADVIGALSAPRIPQRAMPSAPNKIPFNRWPSANSAPTSGPMRISDEWRRGDTPKDTNTARGCDVTDKLGPVMFEARIRDLVENLPNIAELVEPLKQLPHRYSNFLFRGGRRAFNASSSIPAICISALRCPAIPRDRKPRPAFRKSSIESSPAPCFRHRV